MSKPRCTQPGCDGEHTPGVHKLMGEESAGVNLIAEDGDEEEDEDEEDGDEGEDEGWWVGTVGVMEEPDWAEEVPLSAPSSEREREICHVEAEKGGQIANEPESTLSDCSADETAEDEWWDLESTRPSLGRGGAGVQCPRTPQRSSGKTTRSPHSVGAKRRRLKKRPGTTVDQDWEEARRNAWLRQMLSDTLSDEDEERYGRFAESGRWMAELFEIPQHPMPTSGGECSG